MNDSGIPIQQESMIRRAGGYEAPVGDDPKCVMTRSGTFQTNRHGMMWAVRRITIEVSTPQQQWPHCWVKRITLQKREPMAGCVNMSFRAIAVVDEFNRIMIVAYVISTYRIAYAMGCASAGESGDFPGVQHNSRLSDQDQRRYLQSTPSN